MWIRNGANLYNCDQFYRIFPKGAKLIGVTTNSTEVVLGEFWTAKECLAIFESVFKAQLSDTKIIFIKNTRDGMKCLKPKKLKELEKLYLKEEDVKPIPLPVEKKPEEPVIPPAPVHRKVPKVPGVSFFG
jgi:hypothetical protein